MGDMTRVFPTHYVIDNDAAVVPKRRGRRPVKPVTLAPGMTLDIVKYYNRRLYSSSLHRYLSLEDVGRFWDQGIVVRACRSQDRSVDITPQVLMDILLQRVIAGKLKVSEAQLRALAGGKHEISEWKPIETAPRTRRSILVYCPRHRNIYMVSWHDGFKDHGGAWVFFGGLGALNETPTHWMSLPNSPGSAGETATIAQEQP